MSDKNASDVLERLVCECGAAPWVTYRGSVSDDLEKALGCIQNKIGIKNSRWFDPETGEVFELRVELSAGLVKVFDVLEFH